MTAFLAVLRHEFLMVFQGWKTLLVMLSLPVLMLMLVVAALAPLQQESNFVEPFVVALVDQEQSVWTEMLVRQLADVSLISEVLKGDEEQALQWIREGKAAVAIVLPPDLSHRMDRMEPSSAKIYGSSQMSLQSNLLRNIGIVGAQVVSTGMASLQTIREVLLANGLRDEEVQLITGRFFEDFFLRVLQRRSIFETISGKAMTVSLVEYYSAGLLAVFLMFASLPCMKRLVTDRQSGVFRRLRTTPAAPWMSVVSGLLVTLSVSVAQFSLLVLVGARFFHSWRGISAGHTVGLFFATVLATAAFSLLVAAISDEPSTVDLVGYLGVLVMAVVGGSLYPATAMPDWVRPLSALTPTRWAREGFLGIFNGRPEEIARSLQALLLLTAFFGSFAALVARFRKGRM